jgi:hypothetical protein
LIDSTILREFTGRLGRTQGKAKAEFTGSVDAVFVPNPRRNTIHVTATLDDENHLTLRFDDWPTFDPRNGKYLGDRKFKEVLTRSAD